MKASLLTLPALALLLLTQCKKSDPKSALPPETQNGAGTFGCLLNGQPWTPQGNDGTSNYTSFLDRDNNGDIFDIHAYRFSERQSMVLYVTHIRGLGTYSFHSPQRTRASLENQMAGCYWSSRDSTTTYRRGQLTITRLDRAAGIVSGTFAFTLFKPGCDSVRVTQGRFDRKL